MTAMTVQTIRVPLPLPRRHADKAADAAVDTGDTGLPMSSAPDGTCSHVGRCDRDACGQAERVTRQCPSLDVPTTSPL